MFDKGHKTTINNINKTENYKGLVNAAYLTKPKYN